ncbi:MAG: hypothetical protein ACYCV7_09435 [Acidimicrobiales bacterium]
MNTVKEYQKPLLVGALGLVVAILLYAILISPQSAKLAALTAQQTQLQTQQTQLRAKLESLRIEKQQLPGKCAALRKISVQIPSVQNPGDLAAEQSSFYNQLTALVGSSGTSIPSFAWTGGSGATATTPAATATSTVKGVSGVVPIPVTMHITGTFGQMSNFVAGLDSFPRLFVIQSFTLSIGSAGSPSGSGAATAVASPSTPALWVGQAPTSGSAGPYSLSLAGSIYYTTTASAAAACGQAGAFK